MNYDLFVFLFLLQADILQVIPTIAIQLVKSPLRASADLSSVKFIHSAGGPLGTELMKELMTMFNRPFISQCRPVFILWYEMLKSVN